LRRRGVDGAGTREITVLVHGMLNSFYNVSYMSTTVNGLIIGAVLVLSLGSSPLTERPHLVKVRGLRVRLTENRDPDYQVFFVTFDAVLRNNTSEVLNVTPSRVHMGEAEQRLPSGEWGLLHMTPFEISQLHEETPSCLALRPGEKIVIPGVGDTVPLRRNKNVRNVVVRFHFSSWCRQVDETESTPFVTVPLKMDLPLE
jgi:hypothetical protein